MRWTILLAAFAQFLTLPPRAFPQSRLTGADLAGTVVDSSGGRLPGTTVTVTSVDTNVTRSATTDGKGHYTVAALPPGTYKITAALAGFGSETREGIVLLLGQSVTMDFRLQLAAITEAITVTAASPVVEISHTAVSSVVNRQQIESLPINGRNFISFSIITPGVTTDHTPQQGASATSGLSFGGQRARSNNIMVDGLDNNDPQAGAVRSTFSQEAVLEFQVLTNSYSAEFGKAAGGVINIVTKSGTNDLQGNAFFYFRDDALNSKSYFEKFDTLGNPIDLEKSPFSQRQWGATLGGPIRKDKTFFFMSFERKDSRASNLVTIQPEVAELLESLGFPVELGAVPYDVDGTDFLAKVNHHFSPDHALVVRVNFADIKNENIEPFGGTVARSRGAAQLRTDWSLSASQTDVIAEKWVNEFRVQYAPQDQEVHSLDPRCGGPCVEENQGGPTLEITGFASVGRQRFTPQPRKNRRLQFLETISYFEGGHHLKAGVEFNTIRHKAYGLPLHFGGRYIFGANPALGIPNGFEALRRGMPTSYIQGYGNSAHPYPLNDFGFFVQDEWTLGRLVLKPGIRYQRQFWGDLTYDVSDVRGTRLQYPFAEDKNNWAPRIAVAYDLTGKGTTSLHGSYGIYHDPTIGAMYGVTGVLTGGPAGLRTMVLTLSQRCGTVPCSVLAWNSPNHQIPSEETALELLGGSYPSLTFAVEPNLENGSAHQVAIGLDRALTDDLALNANFAYVRGFGQLGTVDYNPLLPDRLGAGRRPNDLPCSANPAAPCVGGGIPGTSASVLQYTSFGDSDYKGLTVSLDKRFGDSHQFLAAYTLSKAEDASTDFQSNFIVQNSGFGRNPNDRYGQPLGFDPDSEWGPSNHDQRHRFVLSGVYVLPRSVALSGIFTAASGRPFTPLAGVDLNRDGNGGAFPPDRARRVPTDESTSVGRNSETTASYVSLDLRLSKRFQVAGADIDAILDVFNVLNRANFYENTNQGPFTIFGTGAYPQTPAPSYGRYTETLPPRQIQLALKLTF